MPITLSNGTYLNETGRSDSRGFPILQDDAGNLYTNQDGEIVLSRSAGSGGSSLGGLLGGFGQSDLAPILGLTEDRLREAFGDASSFEFPSLGEFRSSAEEKVGEFFNKELELLERSINTAKKQETEKRDILKTRLGEDEDFYFKTEDKDFARALQAAQSGFAGRDTATSGFRLKTIGQGIEDRELGLEEADRGLTREGENIDIDFKNFMENLSIKEDTSRLDIDRRKESAVLAQQQLLQQQEANKRSASQSEALDFIRERLGA